MNLPRVAARVTALVALLAALPLAGCGRGDAEPRITRVAPETAAPGALVLVSGENFDRAAVVWIDGRPAHTVTWINTTLLTAVVPDDLATGAYPLEVRALDGQRDAVSLNISASPPGRTPALAQPGASTIPTAAATASRPPSTPTVVAPDRRAPPGVAAGRPGSSATSERDRPIRDDDDEDDEGEDD